MPRASIQIASHEVTFVETYGIRAIEIRDEYHTHAHYLARGRARESGVVTQQNSFRSDGGDKEWDGKEVTRGLEWAWQAV